MGLEVVPGACGGGRRRRDK